MKAILILVILSISLAACGRKGDPEPPAFTQAQ